MLFISVSMQRKIVAYQQLEHSDCGIVCIRIIARYWGKHMTLNEIRALADISREGMSIKGMMDTLEKLGFDSAVVKVPGEEVLRMPLPVVLFWRQSHFVVLYKVSSDGKRYFVADPSQGKMIFSDDDIRAHWLGNSNEGIALLCEPSDDFVPGKAQKKGVRELKLSELVRRTLNQHKWAFVSIVFFAFLCLLSDILLPFVFQRTIDEGIATRDINLIWLLVFAQIMIFVGNYFAQNVADWMMTKLGLKVGLDMMNEYLCKLLARPMEFFARKVNSDLIQKAEDQLRIKDFLVGMPNTLFFMCLNIIVFSGLLVYFNLYIFLFFIFCTGISFLWLLAFIRKRKSIDYTYTACIAENRNNLYELINGITEIKVNNAHKIKLSEWNSMQEKINVLAKKNYYVKLWMNSGTTFIFRIREIAIIGICAASVVYGNMTIGVMMTVSYIIGRLSLPFNNMLDVVNQVQDASISLERVEEIMSSSCGVQDDDMQFKINDILLKNVSFRYPGSHSPLVLKNIDLLIPVGSTIALVGPSGCGKSTLIKLLLNLFRPIEGSISSGNICFSETNQEIWLRNCGIVMQEGTIFTGNILSNIAMSDESPDLQRARKAASLACLDSFIDNLPMGYYSKIGVSGIELSGGQKQRLLIARAIYRDPALLVLDEATSSLDAINEARIVRNLKDNNQGKTVIIAAHRLSTVAYADMIVYMDGGEIIETGSHEDLMALGGAYSRLIARQLSPASGLAV